MVTDEGLQLLVDVNTFLEARRAGEGTHVTEERLLDVISLVRVVLADVSAGFIRSGTIPVELLDEVIAR
jgi:hypothetical protein